MDIFLARQPIFDREQHVFAYELLFRSGFENYYDHWDGDRATSTVLDHSFFSIGMEEITRGKLAFINFTRNLLMKECATLFPQESMAIELLEDIEPDDEVIDKCRKLKDMGYLIVLDDFVYRNEMRKLMDLADIIKVDFLSTTPSERFALTYKVDLDRVKLLAEKVETVEDYEQAVDLGYSYFQGYFFSKPSVLSRKNVPAYKMNYLQILKEINRLDLDYDRLERIFKQDVTLSYKLMTYINSAYFGFPNKIRSIRYALALIGLREAKKWLSLIALSSIGQDKSQELVLSSLFRANLCELLAPIVGLDKYSSDLFLVGLFSLIDAFLDQPMPDVLRTMPLTDEIKLTLLGHSSPLVPVYNLVLSYEKGDWDTTFRCLNAFETDGIDLPALFVQTIERSNKIIPV